MKKKYNVEFFYSIENVRVGEIEVEADSKEEAKKLVLEMDQNDQLYEEHSGHEECESCELVISEISEK